MSLFLLIVLSMFACDLIWWPWAHRELRPLRRARTWRGLLAAFMCFQIACMGWIIFGNALQRGSHETVSRVIVAAVFIWHVLALPMAMFIAFSRTVGEVIHRVKPRVADERVPSRREFLRMTAVAAPPLAMTIATGVALTDIESFRVRSFDLHLPQLPAELDGLVIAHVSDMHVGRFTTERLLRKLVDATNGLRADLILMSGDLIDHSLNDLGGALDAVRRMDSRHGVYMCEGNHDLIHSRVGFETAVKQSGVPLLINESTMLNIRGREVQLMGLRWGPRRNDATISTAMQDLMSQRIESAFPILLAHHPHAFDSAAAAGIPLTLCGHTHGGQLMLSQNIGVGPMIFRYWSGLYEKADSKLIVSNGVGNWFPLRINAPAEIAKITLHRQVL